jgi:hypothetical protein
MNEEDLAIADLVNSVNNHSGWTSNEWAQLCAVIAQTVKLNTLQDCHASLISESDVPSNNRLEENIRAKHKFDIFYDWLKQSEVNVQGRNFELNYMGDEGNGIVAKSRIIEGARVIEVPYGSVSCSFLLSSVTCACRLMMSTDKALLSSHLSTLFDKIPSLQSTPSLLLSMHLFLESCCPMPHSTFAPVTSALSQVSASRNTTTKTSFYQPYLDILPTAFR